MILICAHLLTSLFKRADNSSCQIGSPGLSVSISIHPPEALLSPNYYLPYYPAYNTHFHTLQHLCQGGGACYQQVHKPEHFYIDAMDVWGMVANTLVGSYCLLACHRDEVMMIAILIPWTSQIMFKNRLFPYC